MIKLKQDDWVIYKIMDAASKEHEGRVRWKLPRKIPNFYKNHLEALKRLAEQYPESLLIEPNRMWINSYKGAPIEYTMLLLVLFKEDYINNFKFSNKKRRKLLCK